MEIPTQLSPREKAISFDYSKLKNYVDTEIDRSYFIPNLSPSDNRRELVSQYYKSVLQGYNHIFITKILADLKNPSANICLPLFNNWNGELTIDNMIIINDPRDAERI